MVEKVVLRHTWSWVRSPPMFMNTCQYVGHKGLAIMKHSAAKRPQGVVSEVNLKNQLHTCEEAHE